MAVSCSGSRSFIKAPSVTYPVSLSGSVRDEDGRILFEDDFVIVGKFSYQYKSVHMVWKVIPLTRVQHDISMELVRQIRESDGEAVINLDVLSYGDSWDLVSSIISLGILPGFNTVEVSGDIVKRKVIKQQTP